uniref:Uncharacterized protein n=1 Tax=Octopus bimaculoides TaxID=37653 RepID=A0A0L8G121_OCTBM
MHTHTYTDHVFVCAHTIQIAGDYLSYKGEVFCFWVVSYPEIHKTLTVTLKT